MSFIKYCTKLVTREKVLDKKVKSSQVSLPTQSQFQVMSVFTCVLPSVCLWQLGNKTVGGQRGTSGGGTLGGGSLGGGTLGGGTLGGETLGAGTLGGGTLGGGTIQN